MAVLLYLFVCHLTVIKALQSQVAASNETMSTVRRELQNAGQSQLAGRKPDILYK